MDKEREGWKVSMGILIGSVCVRLAERGYGGWMDTNACVCVRMDERWNEIYVFVTPSLSNVSKIWFACIILYYDTMYAAGY